MGRLQEPQDRLNEVPALVKVVGLWSFRNVIDDIPAMALLML